ncbi:MAG: ATP synthase F1 subunit gamma [Archangiaceae bacterium]|nr:ATP synthase F1 subunit gamma [Archangiaceae bacterium]
MASLRDIRKRIKSVKSTRQITKAMKMVSAAKLRKAQEAIMSARPYAQTLEALINELVSRVEPGTVNHPLLTERPVKKVEVLLVTSDRGLAGGFNANVSKQAWRYLKDEGSKMEQHFVTTMGKKGGDYLRARGFSIRKDWPGVTSKITYDTSTEIANEAAKRFLDGQVDAVYLAYNEFISAISQKVTFVRLLPFETGKKVEGVTKIDFKYEPNAQAVLNALVPQALNVRIFRALLESAASEHGARMSAMENATKNAGEMISSLTLFYNRTRQAAITKELMEIVSGAEALK